MTPARIKRAGPLLLVALGILLVLGGVGWLALASETITAPDSLAGPPQAV